MPYREPALPEEIPEKKRFHFPVWILYPLGAIIFGYVVYAVRQHFVQQEVNACASYCETIQAEYWTVYNSSVSSIGCMCIHQDDRTSRHYCRNNIGSQWRCTR